MKLTALLDAKNRLHIGSGTCVDLCTPSRNASVSPRYPGHTDAMIDHLGILVLFFFKLKLIQNYTK